jgi:HAD superfamily hydrolase (TIGR01509 family)
MTTPRALILDFDGLMVDSEMPEYLAWKEIYAREGAHLRVEDWLNAVGYVNGFDPQAHLEKLTGQTFDWLTLETWRAGRLVELRAAMGRETLPGVRALIDQAEQWGYRLGVASNSTDDWVLSGLDRIGLRGRFLTVRTRDSVLLPKPAPDVYLGALSDLGASAAGSLAFEDSEPGVTAAKAAGLYVVAVPNELTRLQDLSLADEIVSSLEGFRMPAPTAG